MPLLRILHLVGSAYNDFYCGLSIRFAQCCLYNLASFSSVYDFRIALVTPDGNWKFPQSLSSEDIAAAKPIVLSDAIQFLLKQSIDLVIPHMYCIPGMTHYRALLHLLNIPYIGNTPEVMAITAHKGKTKAIVAAAGVKVPNGELLVRGDVPTIPTPAIVKPASSDNSLGVTLVKDASGYEAALKKAFEHSDEVIVETFIEPGREVRCSVIVKDGELIATPLEEFRVDPHDRPIRDYDVKFPELDDDGKFIGWPEADPRDHFMNDPNEPTTKKVQEMAKKAHMALGCRHYSLFDFRIDPNGEPWFLEAGLYTSFGGEGGVCLMAETGGIPLDELLKILIQEALRTKL